MDDKKKVEALKKELARLEKKSAALSEARSRLAPGTSRARVTSANAKWARAAEARDRAAAALTAYQSARPVSALTARIRDNQKGAPITPAEIFEALIVRRKTRIEHAAPDMMEALEEVAAAEDLANYAGGKLFPERVSKLIRAALAKAVSK